MRPPTVGATRLGPNGTVSPKDGDPPRQARSVVHWKKVGMPGSPHYAGRPGRSQTLPLRSPLSLKKPLEVAEPSVWVVQRLLEAGRG